MGTYQRGNIRFENTFIKKEDGRAVAMFNVSCTPPPNGSETHFAYENPALPFLLQRFLQPHEMPAMMEGAKLAGEADLTHQKLADDLIAQFGFRTLNVDEKNIDPAWWQSVDCYTATVGYVITYNVYEIKAVSTADFKVDDVEYPVDETVAVFRVYSPDQYHFVRYYAWNPECCDDKERVPRKADTSLYYPIRYQIPLNPNNWKDKPYGGINPWQGYGEEKKE